MLRQWILPLFLVVVAWVASAEPETWRAEIDTLTANDAKTPPPAGAVLFVGSSSIRLWATLTEDFPGIATINRGFGGSHLADSIAFFDRIVAPYEPRAVVLYAGDNDIGSGRSAEDVLGDFVAFRDRVRSRLPDAALVYLSIKESPSRSQWRGEVRRANQLIGDACARDPRCRFVDVSRTLQTEDGAFRADLFESDGLHITREGYRRWAEVLGPVLARFAPAQP